MVGEKNGERNLDESKGSDKKAGKFNFESLIASESKIAKSDTSPMLDTLLEKCEARNVTEIYLKQTANNNGILSFKKLQSYSGIFTKEKVMKDIAAMPDLLFVSLLNPKPLKQELKIQKIQESRDKVKDTIDHKSFEKEHYIINQTGLAYIINLYRKRKVFSPITLLSEMLSEFELSQEKFNDLTKMVTNIVESRAVYAELITNDSSSDENGQTYEKTDSGKDKDITIVFKHKLAFPENKKKLFSIIILTGLLALLIFTYVQLAPLFFNR